MSDETLRLLWGICLIIGGVCAVIVSALNIMGIELAKPLTPVLSVLLLFSITGNFVLTAQIMKRQKKK